MATFRDFGAVGREIDAMAKELQGAAKRKITQDLAEKYEQMAERAASSDLGGDPKFSGWPPRLDTRVKITSRNAAVVTPTKVSAGPWTVAEFGRNTSAGPIVRQSSVGLSGRAKKAGRGRFKRWNGVTRGKQTASKAVAEAERRLPDVAEDGVRRVVRRHFDVS